MTIFPNRNTPRRTLVEKLRSDQIVIISMLVGDSLDRTTRVGRVITMGREVGIKTRMVVTRMFVRVY
ncbi:hypothetical protein FR483_n801L [Paramecium bursaria Chlorella virus FR483]|uniref:Uncharacterized protein n801L n=1 Tax=Paramecium bursaria Chlorella virus FR483 TaxID=399781 RepID=A7J8F5_PBCVF|nr:hypothetical protein FR483_n801L [Paramecium bursaria Chlorella virus FR483]ABT16086.1 hypothetical protein FR483_n801L [Paramecium bursaria Chlorella virus FR483]